MRRRNVVLTYRPYGKEKCYSVFFVQSVPSTLVSFFSPLPTRALLIVDTNIQRRFVQRVAKALRTSGIEQMNIYRFVFGKKDLNRLVPIWRTMVEFVPDMVIGIGGGTVSDLTGFAASTYQRGIPHILFPTTVLGMADASLGGKTAIDFHGVKNCIGSMHYPVLVINVMESLVSLPKEEFRSGFSEVVKAAVLFDGDFFDRLERFGGQLLSPGSPALLPVIKHSATLKMRNAEDHPTHKIKLLYGHAVGQALEIIENAHLRHGDAVSIGMTIEGALACLLGIWQLAEWKRQTMLLYHLGLPLYPPRQIRPQNVIERMHHYKKLVTHNTFAFVFPKCLGLVADSDKTFLTHIKKKDFLKLYMRATGFIKQHTISS